MKSRRRQRGVTLVELCITLLVVVAFCVFVPTMLMGNMWFTNSGVLSDIRAENPAVSSIVKTQRNAWRCSRILVEQNNGTRVLYELDSNILFSYTVYKSQ